MKERPLLMSAPMVRATLDDRKTVTRRVVKGQALAWLNADFNPGFVAEKDNYCCPFGYAGDRLWLRETWKSYGNPAKGVVHIGYKAGGPDLFVDCDAPPKYQVLSKSWKPSIHMPRWASRISLEIMSIKVERLQDITEEQAKAEGVELSANAPDHKMAFAFLWEIINGDKYPWESNPWVWAISFKRVEI